MSNFDNLEFDQISKNLVKDGTLSVIFTVKRFSILGSLDIGCPKKRCSIKVKEKCTKK